MLHLRRDLQSQFTLEDHHGITIQENEKRMVVILEQEDYEAGCQPRGMNAVKFLADNMDLFTPD